MIEYAGVEASLRRALPEFGAVIDEHLRDNEGEFLAHLVLGDLTRFVLAALTEGDRDVVERALTWAETALAEGDDLTRELIAVSFVENVGASEPENAPFIATWPANLLREATVQGYRPKRRWRLGRGDGGRSPVQ
jgi:hypothetical protein